MPVQAYNSLWIDEDNQQVWVEGEEKELTPEGYKLLVCLYRRANQRCTYAMISQEVYNEEAYWSMKGTIQPAIKRLREKIEPDPDDPKYIINDRGRGYKLILNYKP